MKVWVVALSSFEGFDVRYICTSKETALERWREILNECLDQEIDMVNYCKENEYDLSIRDWENNILLLSNLQPGESCDCDYPSMKEWECEP